jgi:hypothetical protein
MPPAHIGYGRHSVQNEEKVLRVNAVYANTLTGIHQVIQNRLLPEYSMAYIV